MLNGTNSRSGGQQHQFTWPIQKDLFHCLATSTVADPERLPETVFRPDPDSSECQPGFCHQVWQRADCGSSADGNE